MGGKSSLLEKKLFDLPPLRIIPQTFENYYLRIIIGVKCEYKQVKVLSINYEAIQVQERASTVGVWF